MSDTILSIFIEVAKDGISTKLHIFDGSGLIIKSEHEFPNEHEIMERSKDIIALVTSSKDYLQKMDVVDTVDVMDEEELGDVLSTLATIDGKIKELNIAVKEIQDIDNGIEI